MQPTQNRLAPLFDNEGTKNPLDVLKRVYG